MDKVDKLKEIVTLQKQQLSVMEKVANIALLPKPKRSSTTVKRGIKILKLFIDYKQIQFQIDLIKMQPIRPNNVEKGGVTIVGKAHGGCVDLKSLINLKGV